MSAVLLAGCGNPPEYNSICHALMTERITSQKASIPQANHSINHHFQQISWAYYLNNTIAEPLFDPPLNAIPKRLSAAENFSLNFHIAQRLPKFKLLLQQIAKENQINWRLLAAISYQESHWKPRARSPTGVRGMMMLTLTTAQEVGVRNRLDAEQSLRGGAIYLNRICNRLPDTIKGENRIWITLAAYNIGMGHVHDARKLTLQAGANPNKWEDLRFRLLQLEQPWWYQQTHHGYAKGSESVRYVENIRLFYQHLQQSKMLTLPISSTENL